MKDKSKKMNQEQKIKKALDAHVDPSLHELRQWMDQTENDDPVNELYEYADRLDFIQEQIQWLDYESNEEIERIYPILQKLADEHSIPKETFVQRVLKIIGR